MRRWSDATPGVRQWLIDNQPAMQRWRIGTAKERALRVRPDEVTVENFSAGILDQRTVIELAQLEALRCAAVGDSAGEWESIRALFRFSRHLAMFDTAVQRLFGMVAHKRAVDRAADWAQLDRVTANQLKMALQDVRTDYQMTAPMSVVVKFEYLIAVDELNRVEELRASHQRLADDFESPDLAIPPRPVLFLEHEPDLTRRLLQYQTANLLRFVDLPACDQPRRTRGLLYYDSPPLPGSRLLSPAEFEAHCSQAPLAGTHLLRSLDIGFGIQEQSLQSALEVNHAAQRYRRESGQLPETLSELVSHELLPEIPGDPWGVPGAKLQYERDSADPSRAKVWSVGANRIDDSGKIDSHEFGVGDEGLWIGNPPATE